MSGRIRVGVLFGGRSGEHEVSLASAYSVMRALDPERFEVVPIGIAKDGRWIAGGDSWQQLRAAAAVALGPAEDAARLPRALLLDEPDGDLAEVTRGDAGAVTLRPAAALGALDVAFPVLHGPYGEDGTVQGLLELAGIPYVGAGVAASAVCMDKILCKQVLAAAGIPQVPFEALLRGDWDRDPNACATRLLALGLPLFVKPANLGSSVGISKVHAPEELAAAVDLAARYDRRIIVEQGVDDAMEVEISVLGNDDPIASVPGEIVPCNEFYDYNAKYVDGKSIPHIPARLPAAVAEEIRSVAVAAYRAVDGAGLSRIDFLVERTGWRVWLNEINTMPGFTPISMYPKLWEASGIAYGELLGRLVDLALDRAADRGRSETSL